MNEIKSQTQQAEFDKCKDMQRVILTWATGVGKSKMTIDLVNYVAREKYSRKIDAFFIVAEKAHKKNWELEFRKWKLDKGNVNVHVLCYASLKKLRDRHCDILVLDEGHHAFTEKRLSVLESIDATYVYMLSATLSFKRILTIEDIFGKFYRSDVSLNDAIEKEILPDPNVFVIGLDLDNDLADQEIAIENGKNVPVVKWEDRNRYIFRHIPCIIKCTEWQKYLHYTNSMEYWKQRYQRSHNEFHRNKWVNLGSQRKRYLGELKTEHVRKLLKKLPDDNRFICFCSSIAQAEKLGYKTAISSKRKDNQKVIDSFNNKEINSLFAVNMANEGMNLKDIQTGIIVQLDGTERLFIQKFGRSMRAEDPVAYIFYYRNTQDENYLKNALENIDDKFIKYL